MNTNNSHSTNRSNKYTTNSTTSSRSFDSLNLDKFPDFMTLSQYSNLSFCHNPITSFSTLPILPDLVTLKLDFTKITSFNGAKKQPLLCSISMVSSPICSYKYFFEMCLVALGTQILRINDKIVSSKQRKFARENDDILYKYVSSGWLITKGSQPIHLMHYQTRKRICFYTTDKRPKKDLNSEDLSIDNVNSPISKSIPKKEQDYESATYASSFISDQSGDNSSNVNSVNDSPYKLDEKARDALLSKMIQLSHEWNPPPKKNLYDKDKDDFLESTIFDLFKPSMARNRRLVVRDQRPENLFRLPVSIQSESPYADQKKPYLLRKREEYELRIKQKQEQLRRQQEEEEFEYEEEEEEEIVEQERVKNENEMELQDNLQEEKIKDDNITNDKNNLNDNNQEKEENVIKINKKPELKEESIQTIDINDDDIKPIIFENISETKPVQTKRKSIVTIVTPNENDNSLISSTKTDIGISPQQSKEYVDESNNSPLLTESEMEVFRKRRLNSMNKFILNPNSAKQNADNPNIAASPIDDKIVKKRRKTLSHAKSIKYIGTPTRDLSSNNDSSANLTDSNNDFTPNKANRNKLTRRPTYSEILSSRYKEQHSLSLSTNQQDKLEPNVKYLQSPKSEHKFSLTKRKTSFAALDINKLLEANEKAKAEADSNKDETNKETETHSEIETETENENESKNDAETENNNENKVDVETENKNENEDEINLSIENEKEKENELKDENIDKTDLDNQNEIKINDNENVLDKINEENDNHNNDDDLIDNEISQFLLKQKSEEEEEVKSQSKNGNSDKNENDIDEPDLDMLDEMLKGVDDDEDGDLDDKEAELRLEAYQECIEKHPDKENDDDFINEYVEQYLKDHLKK